MPKQPRVIKTTEQEHVYTRCSTDFKRSFDSAMTIWIRENPERAQAILDGMKRLDEKRVPQVYFCVDDNGNDVEISLEEFQALHNRLDKTLDAANR